MADPYITFPDGDAVLRSSDGVDFRLDRIILLRSSPVFATMFSLPTPLGSVLPEPIYLSEPSSILDIIFRSIYPPNSEPVFSSADVAMEVWRAIDKYALTTQPLVKETTRYLCNLDPPLKAWAKAVQLGHLGIRASAASRFFENNSDILTSDYQYLQSISGAAVLNLQRVRRDVHSRMSVVLELTNNEHWYCHKHRKQKDVASGEQSKSLYSRLRSLDTPPSAKCEDCNDTRNSGESMELREDARNYLDLLLKAAVAIDAAGGYEQAPPFPKPPPNTLLGMLTLS
ncbi:hypothetical protein DL93DRAFT_2230405 [Clavulina sp. PMI_390]|nr:hypothetical protein DL93DRAFT_2230405 [Clavulina sp. PMI_390]